MYVIHGKIQLAEYFFDVSYAKVCLTGLTTGPYPNSGYPKLYFYPPPRISSSKKTFYNVFGIYIFCQYTLFKKIKNNMADSNNKILHQFFSLRSFARLTFSPFFPISLLLPELQS